MLFRSVAAIDAALPTGTQPPANDPVLRQAYYIAFAKKAAAAQQIEAGVGRLRTAKYPVSVKNLGEASRPLAADELAELARWIDTLDRI